jgi:hypothetical protein
MASGALCTVTVFILLLFSQSKRVSSLKPVYELMNRFFREEDAASVAEVSFHIKFAACVC